jgi:ketosteroid isomerase-like protein
MTAIPQDRMAQIIDEAFARDFLSLLHAAVNAHDADAVAALCCEDVLWDDPAAPGPLHGRETGQAARRQEGQPGDQRERQRYLQGEDRECHGRAPGKRISVTSAMKNGK